MKDTPEKTAADPTAYAPILDNLPPVAVADAAALSAYKQAVTRGRGVLQAQYRADMPATAVTGGFAGFIDAVLRLLWRSWFARHGRDHGEGKRQGAGETEAEAALLAVGGYGRAELYPWSDIDLMVLTGKKTSPALSGAIQEFIAFLWDIGLHVGHSVRAIQDTVAEAKLDVTVITNLIEARRVSGDAALFERMRRAIGPGKLWPSKKFYLAKLEEQSRRHHKYQDTAYRLEPNVKESPGGLRDIHTIGWIARRHFSARRFAGQRDVGGAALQSCGFLTAQEFDALRRGHLFLAKVRIGLHLLKGRGDDRLLFDDQRALARQFGHSGAGNAPVERFMQQYYRTVMELGRLNEMLLQHFEQALLPAPLLQRALSPLSGRRINARFRTRRGYLEVADPHVFARAPHALLEAFLLLQRQPRLKGVRAATIRLMRRHLDLIDDKFRADRRAQALFMEILRQPTGITAALRRMNRYGVLARYLPEFDHIVGRMQFDLFHAYTVDEHILFVVRNLRRFTVPRYHHEFPLCSQIMATLPKPELAYIAGLYHDIGKGRGGDHSELGAVDARAFCRRHGLDEHDTALVGWLVEQHLLMSSTSQKQDISDARVVREFTRQVGDATRLNYLYVLTVADIRGTNPTLWNNWKANLLADLYHAALEVYRRGGKFEGDERAVRQARQRESRARLTAQDYDDRRIDDLWRQLPAAYFSRHATDTIVWHTAVILNNAKKRLPIVRCRYDQSRGVNNIFIYANDQANLFAHCVGALSSLRLNVVDARIMETRDSHVLDTFVFLDAEDKPVRDRHELQTIEKRVQRELKLENAPARPAEFTVPRALKQFAVRSEVAFKQNHPAGMTILRLRTTDRPAILARVGQVFIERDIRLHNARIATFGEQVEDVFHITTHDKHLITDKTRLEALRQSIIDALSAPEPAPA